MSPLLPQVMPAAGRSNHRHLATNQISDQCGQSSNIALRPTIFDFDVLVLDIARFAKPFEECGQHARVRLWRSSTDKSDHRHRCLLRKPRE